MVKKCPICGSGRLVVRDNEFREILCKKCQWTHSDKKKACFVEFNDKTP